VKLGVIGAGAVGTAVVELAAEYGHAVTAFADSETAVVDPNGIDRERALETKRTDGVVGSDEPESALRGPYDVLIEATPTTLGDAQPGFGYVATALRRDKHVVLANKGPVAERYGDLRDLERQSDGTVLFEATVSNAIPVLSTIAGLGPRTISGIHGVRNGTAIVEFESVCTVDRTWSCGRPSDVFQILL
jgi:homoserine dehydrogenase